jgi:hypothetical protein
VFPFELFYDYAHNVNGDSALTVGDFYFSICHRVLLFCSVYVEYGRRSQLEWGRRNGTPAPCGLIGGPPLGISFRLRINRYDVNDLRAAGFGLAQ